MTSTSNNTEELQRRNEDQELTFELEATTSPTPDLDHLLNRPSRPFAFAPFVATPSDLPTSHKSVARPHTSTTSPTTTRSRRTGRSSTRHRRWNSSSTVPTSILPPVSPHTKKTVQVEQQIDRPPSRASIRATVGSDTGSSSETNRTKGQQKTIPDYLWNIGEQFSSSEAPSAHMLPQRVRKKYKVVVDQAPPDTQYQPGTLQLLLHRNNWLQLLHMLLTLAVLVVCIGILLRG